jgi:hypothetical protein
MNSTVVMKRLVLSFVSCSCELMLYRVQGILIPIFCSVYVNRLHDLSLECVTVNMTAMSCFSQHRIFETGQVHLLRLAFTNGPS